MNTKVFKILPPPPRWIQSTCLSASINICNNSCYCCAETSLNYPCRSCIFACLKSCLDIELPSLQSFSASPLLRQPLSARITPNQLRARRPHSSNRGIQIMLRHWSSIPSQLATPATPTTSPPSILLPAPKMPLTS